jgi:hypothetical protein
MPSSRRSARRACWPAQVFFPRAAAGRPPRAGTPARGGPRAAASPGPARAAPPRGSPPAARRPGSRCPSPSGRGCAPSPPRGSRGAAAPRPARGRRWTAAARAPPGGEVARPRLAERRQPDRHVDADHLRVPVAPEEPLEHRVEVVPGEAPVLQADGDPAAGRHVDPQDRAHPHDAIRAEPLPVQRSGHARPDPGHPLHRPRLPLGLQRQPVPHEAQVALRRSARLDARHDRPRRRRPALPSTGLHPRGQRPGYLRFRRLGMPLATQPKPPE